MSNATPSDRHPEGWLGAMPRLSRTALGPARVTPGCPRRLLALGLLLGLTGCDLGTGPAPQPPLTLEWEGLTFSASAEWTADEDIAVAVEVANHGDTAVSAQLPSFDCMQHPQLFREGAWNEPVYDAQPLFGELCGAGWGDTVQVELLPGESLRDPSWVRIIHPEVLKILGLPRGAYRPAAFLRPGMIVHDYGAFGVIFTEQVFELDPMAPG
jgi:hypothetical protein